MTNVERLCHETQSQCSLYLLCSQTCCANVLHVIPGVEILKNTYVFLLNVAACLRVCMPVYAYALQDANAKIATLILTLGILPPWGMQSCVGWSNLLSSSARVWLPDHVFIFKFFLSHRFLRSQHVAQCPMMMKSEAGWMHPSHCEAASMWSFLYMHCISFLPHAFLLCNLAIWSSFAFAYVLFDVHLCADFILALHDACRHAMYLTEWLVEYVLAT